MMSSTYAKPTTAAPVAIAALDILTHAANALANAIYELQRVITPPDPIPSLEEMDRHILEAACRSAAGKFGLAWLRNAFAPHGNMSRMTDQGLRDALRGVDLPRVIRP